LAFLAGWQLIFFRLHLISQSPETERPDFNWIYWTQFVGLAILGGIAALAHDLSNPITALLAFNVGLSIPALIKTAAELQGPKKKRKTN